MKELFNEKEIKTKQPNTDPLAKFSGYNSEQYLDDVLDFFYAAGRFYDAKKKFSDFKIIDERSLQKNSDVKFIKEIEKYNFNIFERYILLYLAVSELKRHGRNSKSEIIEMLIENKVAKPSIIVKLLNKNSKLFKSKCVRYKRSVPFEENVIEIDNKLVDILFNNISEETEKIKKEDKKEQKLKIMPNEIYNKLNKYVIGQESAIKNIAAAVYEHILKCEINQTNESKDKLDKTNTLIIGPTGTGKTFICNTLSKILDIPIYVADASQMTETGYVGLSPDSIFLSLEKRCRQTMKTNKFPVSIIYIDEVDKIAFKNDNKGEVGNKAVQEEFLKIFESNIYFCDGGRFAPPREYDISNVMFILGGAFSGLDKIIEKRVKMNKENKIGFFKEDVAEQDNDTNILQQTVTEDLIEYGFMHEFIGRLPNKVILNPLNKESLIKILTESQNNIIYQYKQIFKEAGINLEVLNETIEYVAESAIKNNTGARGLKNILGSVLNRVLFESVSNGQKDFVLTPELMQV
ncbi:MAG: AAA family ATPase [Endomicrobiaceae bacterium]|nr:AAA family ATPase [Endomicrobiaceae bacterium]